MVICRAQYNTRCLLRLELLHAADTGAHSYYTSEILNRCVANKVYKNKYIFKNKNTNAFWKNTNALWIRLLKNRAEKGMRQTRAAFSSPQKALFVS